MTFMEQEQDIEGSEESFYIEESLYKWNVSDKEDEGGGWNK